MEQVEKSQGRAERIVDAVSELARPILATVGVELDRAEFHVGGPAGASLRLYLDREGGVTVDDCAEVSRQLSALIDEEEDLIRGAFTLEVSSPGLDRPLEGEADFQRFDGRLVRIQARVPIHGKRREVIGVLRGVTEGVVQVELRKSGELVDVPLTEIAKARLEVEV